MGADKRLETGIERAGMIKQLTQLQEILYADLIAIEDPDQRLEFLEHTCRGNDSLRARLEKLVALRDKAEAFFNMVPEITPPAVDECDTPDSMMAAAPPERAGTRIGRYQLLERLGEGGCGAVYVAEQLEPVRRRVALKIIRVGFDTEHVITRFEQERQTLALMDHPNIARVLDAGTTESGRPFFVMQLVEGLRITDFCEQNLLDLQARLKLFTSVCRAIQHAHQKGIIHCDIKPSNVMVNFTDGVAVPKVIDFGIARATEPDYTARPQNREIALIGTPAYMSPEQLDSKGIDVDTRSDIYGLGALLYELLTGKIPRDFASLKNPSPEDIQIRLRTEPLSAPSARLHACPPGELERISAARNIAPKHLPRMLHGDLDAIVLKAMELDRKQRYHSASELAEDITRHLNHEPVQARIGASGGYRLVKLVRRNRLVFATGIVVAFALSAGFGTSTLLFFREAHARQEQARLRSAAEYARAMEADLRRKAQAGQAIAHAAVHINRGELDQAEKLLAMVTMEDVPSSLESANTYRTIAEKLLKEGRWEEASRCFSAVAQASSRVDKTDTDAVSIHFVAAAAAVVNAKDFAHYEELRHMAADRFSGTRNPMAADEVVKTCLILPANPEMLGKLEPLIQSIERNMPWERQDLATELMEAWQTLSLTMSYFRKGDWVQTEKWARRCIAHPNPNESRCASARAILAVALFQTSRTDEALAELDLARNSVSEHFREPFQVEVDSSDGGFWFDWLIARILAREALGVLES